MTYNNSQYPEFIYEAVRLDCADDTVTLSFRFSCSELQFEPRWTFQRGMFSCLPPDSPLLRRLAFNLGMAELCSYWKAACPPTVKVKAGRLSGEDVAFWRKLYYNGLGEFFYRNGINADKDGFMSLASEADAPNLDGTGPDGHADRLKGNLVPIGGGKDSAVTMELLRGFDNTGYAVNPTAAVRRTAALGGLELLEVSRTIDPLLLECNAAGFLNGHTPFSAILAFSSYYCAAASGRRYIVLSNESSANESYVAGKEVNHQYSKSYEFERDFREYAERSLRGGPEYFSLLRPWNEWRIAKVFSGYPAYLDAFLSCNLGSKRGQWCRKCSKCLFTYIMLAPFTDTAALASAFGGDLWEDSSLIPVLDALCDPALDKPFECVGTREEINAAMTAVLNKRKKNLPPLLEHYARNYQGRDAGISACDSFWDSEHFVPESFLARLRER